MFPFIRVAEKHSIVSIHLKLTHFFVDQTSDFCSSSNEYKHFIRTKVFQAVLHISMLVVISVFKSCLILKQSPYNLCLNLGDKYLSVTIHGLIFTSVMMELYISIIPQLAG